MLNDGLGLSRDALEDLSFSGLEPQDIAARPITPDVMAATGMQAGASPQGYVIPYFDMLGEPMPYYRIKLLDLRSKAKYIGMRGKPNHIYFPPGLPRLLARQKPPYLIVTEGEKKAACAVKNGFPCVALAGVESWRNRQIMLPDSTEFKPVKSQGLIRARIPPGDSNSLVNTETGVVAIGFAGLIDYLVINKMEAIIVYDTDKGGLKLEVQRAAAQLGYELRYRGLNISSIRQLILPPSKIGEKIGLDDFIVRAGVSEFAARLRACRGRRIAFPQHPNPKTFISGKMQKSRLSRKETQDVALSVLMELETRGRRLRNVATQDMFWFDEQTHTLMDVHIASNRVLLHDTSFGAYLYREFNLSATDTRVIGWLASQFHGEPGAEDTITHRVFAKPDDMPDCIAYQLSDSHFIIITPHKDEPYIVCENGKHGVLFEQGHVIPLSHTAIEGEMEVHLHGKDEVLWQKVLGSFNLTPSGAGGKADIPKEQLLKEGRQLAILLYYLSPWFIGWKGIQLPVELTIGEPGSGKSSLYELRQTIITGKPRLSNMTMDIKDWYAGITSSGGLHVLDNVHFTAASKDYQQRLSDELCRLVTEPDPHVEMRKLYTNADVISLPVTTTFALTALEQPFFTTDLIQRSAIFELQVIQRGHDANWVAHQLSHGKGRIGWVAHQLSVVHRFLALAQKKWDGHFRAGHRLKHYEQALMLMAEVLGMEREWIPAALKRATATKMTETDWTMAGLQAYINSLKDEYGELYPRERFGVKEIIEWAEQDETYCKNATMTNGWRLGKYIKSHRGLIQKTLGIYENGTASNRTMYSVE